MPSISDRRTVVSCLGCEPKVPDDRLPQADLQRTLCVRMCESVLGVADDVVISAYASLLKSDSHRLHARITTTIEGRFSSDSRGSSGQGLPKPLEADVSQHSRATPSGTGRSK
jgi:hypothetical protein